MWRLFTPNKTLTRQNRANVPSCDALWWVMTRATTSSGNDSAVRYSEQLAGQMSCSLPEGRGDQMFAQLDYYIQQYSSSSLFLFTECHSQLKSRFFCAPRFPPGGVLPIWDQMLCRKHIPETKIPHTSTKSKAIFQLQNKECRVNNRISDTRLNRTPAQQTRETWRRDLNMITYLSPHEACTPVSYTHLTLPTNS